MKYADKEVIIVGPGTEFLGGIPEYIRGLTNSVLSSRYQFLLFDTLKLKTRNKFLRKSTLSVKELINSVNVFRQFGKYLNNHKSAIVHIHTSSYWGYYEKLMLGKIAKLKKHKVIFHIHGGSFVKFYTGLRLQKVYSKIMAQFDAVVVLTQEMKDAVNLSNCAIIPNAVELPDISIKSKACTDSIIFFSVSVLEKRKRVDLMIRAAFALKEKGRRFKLIIAGDGPEKGYLIGKINELNVQDVVEYKGVVKRKEKDELFRNGDVLILASVSESFGIVIIEAMSYGKGIISTPVGISPHIVRDNENGKLITIDNLEELTAAMDSYIAGEFNLKLIQEENHELVKNNYSWDIVSGKIQKLYEL
jgi:glycosyltransferase involved in cell wall biosynthesis